MKNQNSTNRTVQVINTIVLIIFLLIVSFFVIYPLIYVIVGAVTPGNSMASMDVVPFKKGVTFDHFKYLMNNSDYPKWFRNTFFIALGTSFGTLFVASLGAYVFSRFRFTFKKSMMMSLLILQIFPSIVGMVAVYVILNRLNMLDSLLGLIFVYLAGNIPYNTWLVKSYMDNIPRALDEAARIDGASHFRIYSTIILPIAKPILVFLAITSFTGPWMDYIFPKLVMRSPEKWTLAQGLFSFVTDKKAEFTRFAAGSIIIAVPFVIFFVLTQKMLVTSLGGGAVKE